jgi:hypothetical protein
MTDKPSDRGRDKASIGSIVARSAQAIAVPTSLYILTSADINGLTRLAEFFIRFGGYGLAALIFVGLLAERQERIITQRSKDEQMAAVSSELVAVARETNAAIQELSARLESTSRPHQRLAAPSGGVE